MQAGSRGAVSALRRSHNEEHGPPNVSSPLHSVTVFYMFAGADGFDLMVFQLYDGVKAIQSQQKPYLRFRMLAFPWGGGVGMILCHDAGRWQ